jgi:3-oxoacyl-[acyl-carrier protein] reductase
MSTRLAGETALVTGGSRGIGRAICEAFDSEGAKVYVHYHTNRKAAEEVSRSLKNGITIQCDLGSSESIEQMFQTLLNAKLDVLVNNAGIWKPTPLGSTSVEVLREVVDVNLTGVFWVTQCALPRLNPGARIVNISSVAARVGIAGGRSMYGAVKAGIDSLTRSWALELAPKQIRVNAVAPGYLETDMTAQHFSDAKVRRHALERHPLGRFSAPADVANAVVFLCSQESEFVTGQSLNVSGGFVV